jgi:hypothetical protein
MLMCYPSSNRCVSLADKPFNHSEWIFELKLDGFRALAYLENGEARLVLRNGNTFASFRGLAAQVARKFPRGGCKVKGRPFRSSAEEPIRSARAEVVGCAGDGGWRCVCDELERGFARVAL